MLSFSRIFRALIVCALFTLPIAAQTLMPQAETMLFDANNQYMGSPSGNQLRFKLADGSNIMLPIGSTATGDSWTSDWIPQQLYYETNDCTGTFYMQGGSSGISGGTKRVSIAAPNSTLYIAGGAPTNIFIGSYLDPINGCSTLGGTMSVSTVIAYVDLDTLFTPPFRVGAPIIPAGPSTFPDVPTNHFAYTSIEALVKAGVTSGYANGNFGMGDYVTREQMAVFIAIALGIKP